MNPERIQELEEHHEQMLLKAIEQAETAAYHLGVLAVLKTMPEEPDDE